MKIFTAKHNTQVLIVAVNASLMMMFNIFDVFFED